MNNMYIISKNKISLFRNSPKKNNDMETIISLYNNRLIIIELF